MVVVVRVYMHQMYNEELEELPLDFGLFTSFC